MHGLVRDNFDSQSDLHVCTIVDIDDQIHITCNALDPLSHKAKYSNWKWPCSHLSPHPHHAVYPMNSQ